MKKTFLTFALAGLATAAFAHTSFYKTDAFDAYVDGSLQLDYAHGSHKLTDTTTTSYSAQGQTYSELTVNKEHSKFKTGLGRLRVGTGLDFKNTDGLTAGYYASLETQGETVTWREDGEKTVEKPSKFGQKVDVNKAYVYLGHKDFGTVTLGARLNTVVDYGFDYGLNTLTLDTPELAPNTVLRQAGLDTSSNPTVKYDSANYNGFSFAYSFSSNPSDKRTSGYKRINALHAKYDFGGTVLSATAAFSKGYANESYASTSVVNKVNGFEVALENTSLVEGLYLGLAYDYAKVNTYNNLVKASQVTLNQLSAKAAYTVNQYFTPYLVLGHTTSKVQNSAYKNTKRFDVALGAQSEVYKLDSLNVKLYAEGFYTKTSKKYNHSKDQSNAGYQGYVVSESNNYKDTDKGFALGAVVKF